MSDPLLHIKDSYYFEIPKVLWPRNFQSAREFPAVWVRLDEDFQRWEAERLYDRLEPLVSQANERRQMADQAAVTLPDRETLLHDYEHWKHEDHARHGVPLGGFLESDLARAEHLYRAWKRQDPDRLDQSFEAFLADDPPRLNEVWFVALHRDSQFVQGWNQAKREARNVAEYKATDPQWDAVKIAAYNRNLSGKVLIPQPFGTLRNLHERESGLAVSRFMILEVVIALLILFIFSWLARRVEAGGPPKGKRWNLLEVFLVFIRDQIARPAIGKHEGDKFVPLLWTLFMFILFCNLFGLLPWLGAPTGGWGVTFGLALITFGTGLVFGMRQFGFFGFFLNQIPHMELPLVFAIIIKPILFAIELLGLLIKHAVLSIRLLANMVAGHLVLLGVMGLAFGADAALSFADAPTWQWGLTATIAVVGSAIFSVLELFVAFLQAYIFTFLSALFIGAAIHHH
jgi:F-type H+-transporting ATPase subunit a